jgi:fibronectin type 3 domain-containing protein
MFTRRNTMNNKKSKWVLYAVCIAAVLFFFSGCEGVAELFHGENPSKYGSPGAPTGVSAVALSYYEIEISWNSVPEAEYYNIYQSYDGYSYTCIGNTGINYYTDTGLSTSTTYYYKVSAMKYNGYYYEESNLSDSASATTLTS